MSYITGYEKNQKSSIGIIEFLEYWEFSGDTNALFRVSGTSA